VDFRILGPLRVSREDRSLELGGHRQKVLVCLLLLHANEVVSAGRIIDVLWGEGPPATARKALQVLISRLRRILGAGGWRRVLPDTSFASRTASSTRSAFKG
jgi:DNA-binding SARP family transcriptional activator